MFKKRLWFAFITALESIGIALCVMAGVLIFGFVLLKLSEVMSDSFLNGMFFIMAGFIFIVIGISILYNVYRFINWLFIEPYKYWKRGKKSNDVA